MAIQKQEYYEGAALHLLARTGKIEGIQYDAPFFLVNGHLLIHIKYSTKNRSPWAFTFTSDEQKALQDRASERRIVIALVCGKDGVAAFTYDDYLRIAGPRDMALSISCHRQHREHYEVRGPDGNLEEKVPPANWQRILDI